MAKRILVVDDEADILKAVEFRLSNAGYEVFTAVDGGCVSGLARTHRPDLILLDLRLPVKDGFEVFGELRTDPELKDIPVLFLTASSGPDLARIVTEFRAAEFMLKPFDGQALLEKVASFFE